MKKAIFYLCSLTLFVFASCTKDEQPVDVRLPFLGVWQVEEEYSINGAAQIHDSYEVTVTTSAAGESIVLVSNFGNFNKTIQFEIKDNGADFSIPSQAINIPLGGVQYEFNLSGSGHLQGSAKMEYSYVAAATAGGVITGDCVATKK